MDADWSSLDDQGDGCVPRYPRTRFRRSVVNVSHSSQTWFSPRTQAHPGVHQPRRRRGLMVAAVGAARVEMAPGAIGLAGGAIAPARNAHHKRLLFRRSAVGFAAGASTAEASVIGLHGIKPHHAERLAFGQGAQHLVPGRQKARGGSRSDDVSIAAPAT